MYAALERIDGTHIFYALAVGVVAGVIWYALDTYIVARVETAVGVTPGTL